MRSISRILNQHQFLAKLKSAGPTANSPLTMSAASATPTPVKDSITQKLTQELDASHLQVINESSMHNVPKGSETHFKVVVVSDKFSTLPLIKRHRMVNGILKEELNSGVHALSIVAKTNDEWDKSCKDVEPSPNCRGGFGK